MSLRINQCKSSYCFFLHTFNFLNTFYTVHPEFQVLAKNFRFEAISNDINLHECEAEIAAKNDSGGTCLTDGLYVDHRNADEIFRLPRGSGC